jgi:hypothetical protein
MLMLLWVLRLLWVLMSVLFWNTLWACRAQVVEVAF